jgi:predicted nucleic acid-binding protein
LLTAVTVAEMRPGVARMPCGKRRNDIAGAVDHAIAAYAGRILSFDEHATKAFAEVVSVREAAGRPITVPDAMIAAICMARGLTLATRGTKDFAGLPISLIDHWQDPS